MAVIGITLRILQTCDNNLECALSSIFMCGIAGIARLRDDSVPSQTALQRMVAAIRHRGPDGDGYFQGAGIGLGHARLSIIDLEGGKQPIRNEDGSVWVSFNGEIFNYLELRRDLERRGHTFYTETDTEVLVHLYEDHGEDFVDHLNGQFAIALWDSGQKKLLLVRDRAGILPLYYASTAEACIFASEVKGILATGAVPAEIDPAGLDQVFTYWAPIAPRTVFRGIEQVCPGEIVCLERGQVRRRRYWHWTYPSCDELIRGADVELASELVELLNDATKIRLRADVPVGAYLSGGLDSSSLVALIQRGETKGLRTFSIGFENRRLDETMHQRELVEWLHTEHSSVRCSDSDIEEGFLDTILHTEVPVLRTSPTPMRMLSQLVRRQGFKVVLTGEGADEVLGGYDTFKEAKIRAFWAQRPDSAWRPLLLKRLYPYLDLGSKQGYEYVKAFFGRGLDQSDALWFSHLPRWQLTSQIKLFYSDRMREIASVEYLSELSESLPPEMGSWHPFNRAEYLEAKTLLPGYLLASQGDRMLMANSIEGRFPFLDHRVIGYANQIHPKHKMRGLNEKALLKRGMRGALPPAILDRYKQPYRGPGAASFLGGHGRELTSTLLSSSRLVDAGCFNPKSVTRLQRKVDRGLQLSERDNMAYIGILATQAWYYWFVEQGIRGSAAAHRSVSSSNMEV